MFCEAWTRVSVPCAMVLESAHWGPSRNDRNRRTRLRGALVASRSRGIRSPARFDIPDLRGGLGTVLVLRHAGSAGAVYGRPAVVAGACGACGGVRRVQGRDLPGDRAAAHAGAGVDHLRAVRRPGLCDPPCGWFPGRPLVRAHTDDYNRRRADGHRSLSDGVRGVFPAGADLPRGGRRRLQGQYLQSGRRTLPAGRRAARERVPAILPRDQFRGDRWCAGPWAKASAGIGASARLESGCWRG